MKIINYFLECISSIFCTLSSDFLNLEKLSYFNTISKNITHTTNTQRVFQCKLFFYCMREDSLIILSCLITLPGNFWPKTMNIQDALYGLRSIRDNETTLPLYNLLTWIWVTWIFMVIYHVNLQQKDPREDSRLGGKMMCRMTYKRWESLFEISSTGQRLEESN